MYKSINFCLNQLFNIKELNREGRTADWNPLSWYKVEFSNKYNKELHTLEVNLDFVFVSALVEDIDKVINTEIERVKEKIKCVLNLENPNIIKNETVVFESGSAKSLVLTYDLNEDFEKALYGFSLL
ncbi:MAG: hypothetical protein IJ880_11850 [Bacilli bacterium]|nr:hypothetical protein [Bacilli bacterium]